MRKKLPSKWCVRVNEDQTPNEIYGWRIKRGNGGWYGHEGYLNEKGFHTKTKPVGHIELTLQEFKILVLKEEPENYFYLIEFFKKLNIE